MYNSTLGKDAKNHKNAKPHFDEYIFEHQRPEYTHE